MNDLHTFETFASWVLTKKRKNLHFQWDFFTSSGYFFTAWLWQQYLQCIQQTTIYTVCTWTLETTNSLGGVATHWHAPSSSGSRRRTSGQTSTPRKQSPRWAPQQCDPRGPGNPPVGRCQPDMRQIPVGRPINSSGDQFGKTRKTIWKQCELKTLLWAW